MGRRQKPIPPNENKLRRKLSEMTGQVRGFLYLLDALMLQPSTVERVRKIADLCNRLGMYNDGVRYFWCGVDYRKDKPWTGEVVPLESAPFVAAVDPVDGESTS